VTKPDACSEAKADACSDAKPDACSETKPDACSDTKSDACSDAKPDANWQRSRLPSGGDVMPCLRRLGGIVRPGRRLLAPREDNPRFWRATNEYF
jgi:hypothetical protein